MATHPSKCRQFVACRRQPLARETACTVSCHAVPIVAGRCSACPASAGTVASGAMSDFLAGLPKCELHVHLEGTLEAQMATALAARHGVPGVSGERPPVY